MKTAEDEILRFVQPLASQSQEVKVEKIDGDPVVFQVTISKNDLAEVSSMLKVIQAIAGYSSGLTYGQFEVKILTK